MNQLNQFVQQMQSLFAGMTPQSKLMALLLSIGIGLSSVFLIQGATSGNGSMVYLLDGRALEEDEIAKIGFALGSAGLKGWEPVGNRIRVPKASFDEYYKAIKEAKAMPESTGDAMANAVNNSSFLETTKTTEARHMTAKIRDLSNAIKRFSNAETMIQDAYVTYDDKKLGFTGDRKQVASVAIKTRGGKELTGEQRTGIIIYLQKSFAGLQTSDIAVLCNGRATVESDDPTSGQQNRYYQLKSQQEEKIRHNAERLLMPYGNVLLAVNVEIDPVASEKTEILTIGEKPLKVQSVTTKKDVKNQRLAPGGRPGTDPNATSTSNTGKSLTSSQDQNSESKEQTESERSISGNTITQMDKVGLQIKQVSVSVSIPFSYYRKAAIDKWRQLNPDKPEKDFTQSPSEFTAFQAETARVIQKMINGILPKIAAGEDKSPRVSVEPYQDMPVLEPPAISFAERALDWLSQSWQTLALIGLVGVALMSLRSFAKTMPTANDSAFERGFDLPLDDASDIDLSSLTEEENESFDEKPVEDISPPRLRTTGGDIKNDLTAMVRENPDAAATMLRNWISEST